jgi:hypothetical protein
VKARGIRANVALPLGPKKRFFLSVYYCVIQPRLQERGQLFEN